MEYKLLTLQELQTELLNKNKSQILYRTEYQGKSIVIPPNFVGLMGDHDGEIQKTTEPGILDPTFEHIPISNADGVYTVPAGKKKRIIQVYADLVAAGVADRDAFMVINKSIAATSIVNATKTGNIRLTDGQSGSIFMGEGSPETFLNDNGTMSSETTNILPITLEVGDGIVVNWNNKNVNDRCRLQVLMIDLPVV